ncbi:hypothetical protein [Singulisphaera acidiphila]|uniref:Uncharacterized protein n=1 Tax=Singulisphaera acidiphila (strain ATCC BAA-1392 / DSM 18658 / VKM B-2454 / MOB10) TaxID=886293 RepID=L0DC38_SINAD|nr:hypothetical protein [Singulisphaera acidiphila]AGA26383.1 hypothetical protein Sinac_2038 [Singulisphaera acidiphila DSM 18658]
MAKAGAETQVFVESLAENRRGQLEVCGRRDKIRLIVAMARAYPDATISVLTTSIRRGRWLRHFLAQGSRKPVEHFHGGSFRSEVRLRVCTFNSFENQQTDILVFERTEEAASAMSIEHQKLIADHRVYGFGERGNRYGTRTRLLIEALVGPTIYQVPDHNGRRAPVRVLLSESPLVTLPPGLDPLERKRLAVWHHDRRNSVIANLAKAFDAGQVVGFPGHDSHVDDRGGLSRTIDGKLRMAVLVESPEHGSELARRLPGWVLQAGPSENGPGSRITRTILTLIRANTMTRLDADVLIRADGSNAPLELLTGGVTLESGNSAASLV